MRHVTGLTGRYPFGKVGLAVRLSVFGRKLVGFILGDRMPSSSDCYYHLFCLWRIQSCSRLLFLLYDEGCSFEFVWNSRDLVKLASQASALMYGEGSHLPALMIYPILTRADHQLCILCCRSHPTCHQWVIFLHTTLLPEPQILLVLTTLSRSGSFEPSQ